MGTMLIVIAVIAASLFLLPRLLASPETRLFRPVWSSETLGGAYGAEKQGEAVRALMDRFGIDFAQDADLIRERIGRLLAAATEFDVRYRNNLGVQTTSVLARELLRQKGPDRLAELTSELEYMCKLDVVALMDTIGSQGTSR